MESNDLSMEEKTRARAEEKRERENKGFLVILDGISFGELWDLE